MNTIDRDLLEFYQDLYFSDGHPRFHQLADYRNLRWLRFLSDVLTPLTALTQYAQSRSMSFDILMTRVETTIRQLQDLLKNPGKWEQKFMENVEIEDGWTGVTYHGFNLRLRRNWKKDLEDSKVAFIEAIVTDLNRRFENLGPLTNSFRVLTKFDKMNEKEIDEALSTLAKAYDMDENDLEIQFINWRVIYQDESLRSGVDALEHLATVRTDYNLLYRLYSILVALPYATAECERGFSLMNDIKSDVRNRIGNSLIDLMLIAMYGDEHEFDYDILGEYVAENIWHYKKA